MDEYLIQFSMNEIIKYLEARPQSADTVEGIHYFWIRWPVIPESILVTIEALHRLREQQHIDVYKIGEREIWRKPRTGAEE